MKSDVFGISSLIDAMTTQDARDMANAVYQCYIDVDGQQVCVGWENDIEYLGDGCYDGILNLMHFYPAQEWWNVEVKVLQRGQTGSFTYFCSYLVQDIFPMQDAPNWHDNK